MPDSRADLTHPPRRLPHTSLPALSGGAETPIIWRRTAPILLYLHGGDCSACSEYVARVADSNKDIAEWDGRVLTIVPESPTSAASGSMRSDLPFPILEDRAARLRDALRVVPPTIIIADQWGEIYERIEAGESHQFPEPEELVDWARVIAVKCPECEGEVF